MQATVAPSGLAKYVPILGWLPKYPREWLRLDLVAGLTAAAVVIPQAMAYASLAGLPVEVGLYTALAPILHFSIGALTIFGGLILLILALTMVLGGGRSSSAEHGDTDPMSLATSPLAIPLTLNPVGIVLLLVASVEVKGLPDAITIIVMILIIMAVDLVVLYASDRVAKYLSHATVELSERVLGILLGALAIELILIGLAEVGVINLVSH